MIAWNCQYLFNNYWFKKWFSNVIEWRGKLMKNIGKTKKKKISPLCLEFWGVHYGSIWSVSKI